MKDERERRKGRERGRVSPGARFRMNRRDFEETGSRRERARGIRDRSIERGQYPITIGRQARRSSGGGVVVDSLGWKAAGSVVGERSARPDSLPTEGVTFCPRLLPPNMVHAASSVHELSLWGAKWSCWNRNSRVDARWREILLSETVLPEMKMEELVTIFSCEI